MKIFDSGMNQKIIVNKKKKIRIYLCGPTLYESVHLGHARFLLFFDLVYRIFKYSHNEPKIVINITDIDPKIAEKAGIDKVSYSSIVTKNFKEFSSICKKLSIDKSFVYVKVSDYTNEAIKIIKFFLKNKIAYYNLGNIYLKTSNTPLGKLSNLSRKDFNDLRFDIHPGKRNINDILLWNSTDIYENHLKDDELGNGIPWWHIQDISVIMGIFSGKYDIHGGGTDLIIPHHEYINSILYQLKLRKYPRLWLHVGLVYLKNKKMSKSLNNVVFIDEILEKFNSNTIRLYCYSKNYRFPLVYSCKILEEYATLEEKIKNIIISPKTIQKKDNKIIQIFIDYLKDDFNTCKALKILRKCVKEKRYYETKKMTEILGLQY